MYLIRDWLKNEHLVIPNDVLETMKSIAEGASEVDGQGIPGKLVLEVMKGIPDKV